MKLFEKGIIIRKTAEADLKQIYAEGMNEPLFLNMSFAFTAENLAVIFASDKSICFTAARKKKILGFIIGSVENNESVIHWMMVKEKLRGAGIGQEMLKQYIETSKKNAALNFLITVSKNNTESVKFFTGYGFSGEDTLVQLKLKF